VACGKTNELTWVCDAYCEEFVENVTDYFNRVTTRLVANRVLDEQLATSESTSTSNICIVVFQIRERSIADKFVQDMTCSC
jgi:hypothetical protein